MKHSPVLTAFAVLTLIAAAAAVAGPVFTGDAPADFTAPEAILGVNAFAGSYEDAGIGEDFVPGAGPFSWINVPGCPVAAETVSFSAVKALFR